ncbi:MAG: hypothetical protein M3461_06400 [Pseudomonadota bacterium]|nr:hypothetical protein [Pseudomonadota bacterium]
MGDDDGGLLATAVVPLTAGAAGPPSAEEMWRVIQAQQKTIDELKAKLEQSQGQLRSTSKRVEAAEQKVEATAEAVEAAEEKPTTAANCVDRTRIGDGSSSPTRSRSNVPPVRSSWSRPGWSWT